MESHEKPLINYPCNWTYKLIGTDKNSMANAIASLLKARNYSIKESNCSKTGKYLSLEINLTVQDESDRNHIYQKLVEDKSIRMVI